MQDIKTSLCGTCDKYSMVWFFSRSINKNKSFIPKCFIISFFSIKWVLPFKFLHSWEWPFKIKFYLTVNALVLFPVPLCLILAYFDWDIKMVFSVVLYCGILWIHITEGNRYFCLDQDCSIRINTDIKGFLCIPPRSDWSEFWSDSLDLNRNIMLLSPEPCDKKGKVLWPEPNSLSICLFLSFSFSFCSNS